MYYKMVVMTAEKYTNAGAHTITVKNKKLFWVKMIDVPKGFGFKNMADLVIKEICGIFETKNPTEEQKKKYIKTESEITKKPADDSKYKYARRDTMEKIIKNCSGVKKCNDCINRMKKGKQRKIFRYLLRFKKYDIMKVIESLRDTFEGENIQTHYRVLGCEIDIYIHDHKLAVEIDEKDHQYRGISSEIERQKALEEELGPKFIRINLDKKNFNIFKAQNEIFRHMKDSTKELTKKSLIRTYCLSCKNILTILVFKKC